MKLFGVCRLHSNKSLTASSLQSIRCAGGWAVPWTMFGSLLCPAGFWGWNGRTDEFEFL